MNTTETADMVADWVKVSKENHAFVLCRKDIWRTYFFIDFYPHFAYSKYKVLDNGNLIARGESDTNFIRRINCIQDLRGRNLSNKTLVVLSHRRMSLTIIESEQILECVEKHLKPKNVQILYGDY